MTELPHWFFTQVYKRGHGQIKFNRQTRAPIANFLCLARKITYEVYFASFYPQDIFLLLREVEEKKHDVTSRNHSN